MVITCPSCRGQGHVEGNDCSCLGWGWIKVRVLGPCNRRGEVQTEPLGASLTGIDVARILQDRASKGR